MSDPAANPDPPQGRIREVRHVSRLPPIVNLLWQFVRGPEPSAKTDWFKKCIDVTTLAVIVIGLYFAFDQAEKLAIAIDSSTWNNVNAQSMSIDKVFIDNPDFRKYFYDGKSISDTDPQYDRAKAISEYVLDFMDDYYTLRRYLSSKTSPPAQWEAFFNLILKNSPIACNMLKERPHEFSDDLKGIAEKSCRQFDNAASQKD